jgi:DNA-binding transcriptional regulator YiaG
MHEDAFRELRKSMGLTQAQMASLLRLPVATVRTLEARTLDPATSKKLIPTIRRAVPSFLSKGRHRLPK